MALEVKPIGTVRDSRTDIALTDHWGEVTSTIVVDERFGDGCLLGLDAEQVASAMRIGPQPVGCL